MRKSARLLKSKALQDLTNQGEEQTGVEEGTMKRQRDSNGGSVVTAQDDLKPMTSRSGNPKVLQDKTNIQQENAPTEVVKKQKSSDGGAIATAQHVDVEPTTRVTRRISRELKAQAEQEEREKTLKRDSTSSVKSEGSEIGSKKLKSVESEGSEIGSKKLKKESDTKTSNEEVSVSIVPAQKKTVTQKKPVAKVSTDKATKDQNAQSSKQPSVNSSSKSAASSTVAKTAVAGQSMKPPTRRKLRRSDPCQCLEIISPMYDLFYQYEEENLIKPYMTAQKDINNRMRAILVDWLIEVHYKFKLQTSTLWLAVNLLDRYLEKKALLRNRLQLLGVTCLLVSCKFEEIYPPEVRDCAYITDNAYNREEILSMERSILSVLDYQLCVPTGYHFLTRYLNIINANDKIRYLAFYFAERSLQENLSLVTKPSKLVAGALYAALHLDVEDNFDYYRSDEDSHYTPRVWPDTLTEETGFDPIDLLPLARSIVQHVDTETVTSSHRRLNSAKKKYMNDKFCNVAEMDLPNL